MKRALVIVDIQKDYFPGGKMELAGSMEASEKAKALLASFRDKGLPVVHIQHISSRRGATFFLPGTEGVKIHENVQPRDGEAVFEKHYPNSFRETPLLEYLRANNIAQLVISGMMTHMCIDATIRAAFDFGFECSLAYDACATRALAFGSITVPAEHVHASFVSALHGVYATAVATGDICSPI
jgi:nicotinamidase-related amidase